MNKQFKSQVQKFFRNSANALVGFENRRVDDAAVSEYSPKPIVLLTTASDSTEYFFAVLPVGTSPGKMMVESGWKSVSVSAFPVVTVDRALAVSRQGDIELDWSQSSFALRLSKLCHQGPREIVWDLFAPEVWDPTKSSYEEFARRTLFSGTDNALNNLVRGELSEAFVESQVTMVCGNVLRCMREFGVPFLAHIASLRGECLMVGQGEGAMRKG
jgi:hypothetical protein